MALYLQDTVQQGLAAINVRLETHVRWYVEQKARDNDVNDCNKYRSLQGAAARKKKFQRKSSRQWKVYKQRPKNRRLHSMNLKWPVFARRFGQSSNTVFFLRNGK